MISFSDIQDAVSVVAPVVHRTPILTSRTFNERCGNSVFLKAENFQRIGAFKIRGAYNKIASLTADERARGVVAHSSGNHAQGVALASRLLGVRATIVMPRNSQPNKIEATRAYGGTVVFSEDSTDDRERVANELRHRDGLVLVPPFDDDKIIAGQGTVAVEIAADLKDLDYLFVPVGGGGLIAGSAVAAKHLISRIKIIGVETANADDAARSFRKKEIVKIDPPETIADGIRTQSLGVRTFEIILKYVDDIITVTDDQVIETMKFLLDRMKIVVEPTGAVAPAAVYHNALSISGKKICAVVSGGNVSAGMLQKIIETT
jgi:threonine ammonia-lyase medium form